MDQVSKELKIAKSTLSKWIRDAANNNGVVNHRGSGNYDETPKSLSTLLTEILRF